MAFLQNGRAQADVGNMFGFVLNHFASIRLGETLLRRLHARLWRPTSWAIRFHSPAQGTKGITWLMPKE